MILRYILSSILFVALLFATEQNHSPENLTVNLAIFLLMAAILYLSYKTFILYQSKRTKYKDKEDQKEKISLNTADNILLDENEDFIQFLKANHTSSEVHQETYRVQNLLNEVYGLLEPLLEKNHTEFIYDIDVNVPIELVGDSLLIEKALYTLLSTFIDKSLNTTIIVHFLKDSQSNEILINIFNTDIRILKDTSLLNTTYTLLRQLNGYMNIKDNSYNIHLPFLQSPIYHESYYTLPQNVVGQHVLLIEDNILTAKIITKTLHNFGLEVTTELSTELSQLHHISRYDIIILDTKLLTPAFVRHIEEIQMNKALHIISLEILYGERDRRFKPNPIVHKYLYKPLSTGMLFGLLYELYVIQNDTKIETTETKTSTVLFIEEVENINRESFQDFNHIHILVVEDNKINQKIIQSVLSKSKITITIANNGQEALNYINSQTTIDIVLMDINMPIMDGYQATKKIRQNSNFSDLPIVIVSGLGFRNEIEQMYLAGANAHLTKPFKIGELYAAFNIFLTKNKDTSLASSISYYIQDNNILDITQGTSNTQNILAYRDTLREILMILKYSDEKIKEYIIKKDYSALEEYCTRIVSDTQYIGATNINQVCNEIRILLQKHEEELLQHYITLYRDTWIRTQRHIELYLKSVDAY